MEFPIFFSELLYFSLYVVLIYWYLGTRTNNITVFDILVGKTNNQI